MCECYNQDNRGRRRCAVSPVAERLLVDEEAFISSLESIEIVDELERRRKLVAEGKSRLLTEEESWESIRAAGYEI